MLIQLLAKTLIKLAKDWRFQEMKSKVLRWGFSAAKLVRFGRLSVE